MKRLAAIAAITLSLPLTLQAGETCGDYKSAGNPLPCSNGGNCTWWTWREAKAAGWAEAPTGNANKWDDAALLKPKLYVVSTTPTAGSVGVKESSPYCPVARDSKGKCPTALADTGHVAWVTSVSANGVDLGTTEMNYGVPGMKAVQRKSNYFDRYVRNTDGVLAATVGCSDAVKLDQKTDAAGNVVTLYSSKMCLSRWMVATAKNPADLVQVSLARQSPALTVSANGRGAATSPMVQVVTGKACTSAKFKSVTIASLCG